MVKHENIWGTVCDDDFGKTEAQAACKTLGFDEDSFKYEKANPGFAESVPILMDDVKCINSTSDFLGCSHAGWGDEDCSHNEDVLLTCEFEVVCFDFSKTLFHIEDFGSLIGEDTIAQKGPPSLIQNDDSEISM